MLNIVEPTLNSYTGHCFSLVQAIVESVKTGPVRIWAGVESDKFWNSAGTLQPYFHRFLRRIQSFWLYRRLLREPGKILLSTANSLDFLLINWAAPGVIPKGKVYLYVHWLGGKTSHAAKLTQIAQQQPNLRVLCTTDITTAFFNNLGFQATTVLYPRLTGNTPTTTSVAFDHLLCAGAARLDKGIDHIANFVEDLAVDPENWPLWVQTSPPHQSKHPPAVLAQIEKIHNAKYAGLRIWDKTLSPAEYLALFEGAISVQPYSAADFEDRVSGVALDAITAGCPIIVTSGTWLAQLVLRHNAGVVTNDLTPAGLRKAVLEILSDYPGYAQRALKAGVDLRQKHSADQMVSAIFEN